MDQTIKLYGRVFIQASISVETGLIIGGNDTGLEIGGVDKVLIRNSLNNQPYIPGSSLRGKMRSQIEKVKGLSQNKQIGQKVKIHVCDEDEFKRNGGCPVCELFGVPAELSINSPSRLIVRDVSLDLQSDEGKKAWENAHLDLPYAELKTEVAIDRVTSAATPRTLERVPAGAIFGPSELIFSIYGEDDFNRLKLVFEGLQLVEDDYIGGAGSRGSGKVRFKGLQITARAADQYSGRQDYAHTFDSVQELADDFANLKSWLVKTIPVK